jgi:hypothetical protein
MLDERANPKHRLREIQEDQSFLCKTTGPHIDYGNYVQTKEIDFLQTWLPNPLGLIISA